MRCVSPPVPQWAGSEADLLGRLQCFSPFENPLAAHMN